MKKKYQIKPKQIYSILKVIPLITVAFIMISIGVLYPPVSQILYIAALVLALMIIYKYYYIRSYIYEITIDRIKLKKGIIGKKIDFVELYRVRDMAVRQPFLLQMIGAMDFELDTSDKTHPKFVFQGIKYSEIWTDKFRDLVERVRKQRVHEID